MIQILEDVLRACVLDFGENWADYLPLAKFAYNNSYQSSIGMAPYEAFYGRSYSRPCVGRSGVRVVYWDLRLSKKLQKRYNSSRKNLRLLKIDRKSMQTKGEGPWSLRKGIGCL